MSTAGRRLHFCLGWLLVMAMASGCVSRSRAREQARSAFQEGQLSAMTRLQQNAGPTVLMVGPVKTSLLSWTPELTLTKAIISAEYIPRTDPNEIFILRNGQQIRVAPQQLLNGEDIPLQAGDIVELKP